MQALRSVSQAAGSESVISEAGEQLLQEDTSTLESVSFIKLQEALTRQYDDYIRDLEEDRASLRKEVEKLEEEKMSASEEVQDLEQALERKCARISQLKESLNITNDKHSKLLREDLEKNYRIIELEGKIEDLEAENERLKDENRLLKDSVEALEDAADSREEAAEQPNGNGSTYPNAEQIVEDKKMTNDNAILDKDVASLKEQLTLIRTKRSRNSSIGNEQIEFFKMKTLKKFPKKRKIELTNADPVREDYVVETTFFSDTSTSSPERTILEESPRRSSFFKSLFRSSAR